MKAKLFLNCSVESIKYMRGKTVHNYPVCVTQIQWMKKSIYSWYPDNKGKPSIVFKLVEDAVEWAFNNEEERNNEYQRLLEYEL
jgi:hypothetical protein